MTSPHSSGSEIPLPRDDSFDLLVGQTALVTGASSGIGRVVERFGGLDILVNNAGIGVNLTGHFLCAREAVRIFKRRGVVRDVSCAAGKILFITSVHDRIGEVEDIGRVAAWMVSDQSDYITGPTVAVDGGMTLFPGFLGGG